MFRNLIFVKSFKNWRREICLSLHGTNKWMEKMCFSYICFPSLIWTEIFVFTCTKFVLMFWDELLCNHQRTKGRKKGNKRLAHGNCRSFIRVNLSRKQVQNSTMSRLLIGSSNVYRSYRVLTFNKFPEDTMIRFVYNKSF